MRRPVPDETLDPDFERALVALMRACRAHEPRAALKVALDAVVLAHLDAVEDARREPAPAFNAPSLHRLRRAARRVA